MTLSLLGTPVHFADPVALLLLAAVPAIVMLRAWRERRSGGALLFPSLSLLPARRNSWRRRLRPLLVALRTLALVLLVVALARPQAVRASEIVSEGIDIAVVVDVSGSMSEGGFSGGQTKMDAVKRATQEFLKGLKSDRAALVIFGTEPLVLAPLTLDHDALVRLTDTLEAGGGDLVGGATAMGSGLATGLNVLRESVARSKVAILLTDGAHNSGQVLPLDAARVAKLLGVRVYSIGAVTRSERASGSVPVDEALMREMAEATGGRYFPVSDGEALRQIYEEIAQLERTRIGVRTEFASYEDVMLPFLLAGTLLLLIELLFGLTVFRRAP